MINVNAVRGNAARAEQFEKFATAAADVEHVRLSSEQLHVFTQPAGNILRRSAKLIFEAQVLEGVEIGYR